MKRVFIFYIALFTLYFIPVVNSQEQKIAAAVMELKAMEGISKGVTAMLSNYLRAQLVNTNKFTIVTRENMEEILKEQKLQLSGCTSNECVVEVGKFLGVRKMFTGSAGKIGTTYQIDLNLIDVESGKIEKAECEICPKCEEEALYVSLHNIACKIAGLPISGEKQEKVETIMENKENTEGGGAVLKVIDKDEIMVSLGSSNGIKLYDDFEVKRVEQIVNPQTKEILGQEEYILVRVTVYDLKEKYSYARVNTKYRSDPIKVGDKVTRLIQDTLSETTGFEATGETTGMVLIPAGEFLMGSPVGEGRNDEYPQHKVYLGDYYIDKYEVTNEQYARFLNKWGKDEDEQRNPMIYEHGWGLKKIGGIWQSSPGYEKHPVVCVTWFCASQYAKWAGKRLPTEAEWEKACRASSTTTYCYGNDESVLDEYAWYDKNSEGRTHPVGEKKPNQWGIYDLYGNVWEWCSDWYSEDYYKKSPDENPQGPSTGSDHVLRGGSWDYSVGSCRSAYRRVSAPTPRWGNHGFRCVISK